MKYVNFYDSPLGRIILTADDDGLSGLWFEDQKYFELGLNEDAKVKETKIFAETVNWLDEYFDGKEVKNFPRLSLYGTDFQKKVWNELLSIPYGKTLSYGEIAERLNEKSKKSQTITGKNLKIGNSGYKKTSARAVGGAVGHNHISIIIPCHRVIGTDGKLTGYAGGIERKIKLLEIEKAKIDK